MSLQYAEFLSENSSPLTCCQRACPVHTDVASYVALIAQGRFSEALAIVREENPFPGICGRVCDNACEIHCRRAEGDDPVAIRALKRFLADRERADGVQWPKRLESSRPEKVAIIGGGPAGLTAASDVLRRGFPVTVFEALPKLGGMMRVGIPDYRLPAEVLDGDLEYLHRLGIDVKLNTALGRDFTLSDLKADDYKAVLLATGAHGNRGLNIEGSQLNGVMFGIDFLRQVKLGEPPEIGPRVVVIGGGDVAMDTARTALRMRAETVDIFCLESREQMPAHDWESREALDEQIRFNCGWGPAEFIGTECVRQVRFVACTSVFDPTGKFAPAFDSKRSTAVEADTVLLAVGQVAQFAHVPEDGIEVTPGGLYDTDPTSLQTTAPWVFAAGDCAYGTATVIRAVASGHEAAASICEYLDGRPPKGCWEPTRHDDRVERIEIPSGWEEQRRVTEPERPSAERVRSFAEVRLGLSEAAAIAEAARCMRCDHETRSCTYSRNVRERIYHLARDVGRDETACLDLLRHTLSQHQCSAPAAACGSPFDDLVFLPANLTRLVIDPYREPCNTLTRIGERASKPMALAGPVLIGGVSFADQVVEALCSGAKCAGVGVHAPIDAHVPDEDIRVMRVVPLQMRPQSIGNASALELTPETPGAALDAGALRLAAEAYRSLAPDIPIGVGLAAGPIAANVQAAVAAELDFVMLYGMALSDELTDMPNIAVLGQAVQGLREINREEHIDILYFGCIRGGGDVAKALALGAKAVMMGHAALIAAGGHEQGTNSDGAERVARFLQATLMETSILARGCGKTDVHNLEPEDVRSLTVATSQATGMPLVGTDKVYSFSNANP